jgi:hypothetical protein
LLGIDARIVAIAAAVAVAFALGEICGFDRREGDGAERGWGGELRDG